ncbi:HigA family addiction module antitoxin [Parasutterella excrementihominis]|uniref:HigA family addiction module antitoxin n=1 Tax=Parasutterella excrementihominis TaxID=487175 RepID=UPI0026667145|nr:HigA family addiction module antitoxin [Parasutterella excrementihominis]
MTMFNPPHAGMLIKDVIETKGITASELSNALKLQDSSVAKLLSGELNISEGMARRIEEVLDIDAQLLLEIQNAHSLWRTKNSKSFPDKNP